MMISEVYVLFNLKLGFADQTLDCTVHLFRFPHLLLISSCNCILVFDFMSKIYQTSARCFADARVFTVAQQKLQICNT